ncbi:cation diffusion facilitator family transporter [Saccharothrix saharensis]|uniref:Cation diffusion facilitator family transporter n=1 Tax=Saccharothrix saharensis TaxID=571190 RepID=A0A543J8M9_9PSEU|nr:cation diffusion facilitator family transporter [Saccharothrix saharensis]TQM79181.1 cation diffusion facilitator family transporter [Saccharothrix saharensis]
MATIHDRYELPPEKAALHRRAVRLEWWTIAFFVVAIAALAIVLGQSQAMKAAWVEDILALAPPIAFLVANRYRNRPPDEEHPYGHHRSVAIAFLASALALLALGGYILVESVLRLVQGERPPIGLIEVFGHTIWLGWPMIAVLLATMVPAILLGRAKTKLAVQLHDKVLHADAEMNRADWLTAGAAVLGILGIGAGLWWADAVAAIVISADIVRDGLRTTRTAVADLMDRRPRTVTDNRPHPLLTRLTSLTLDQPWVADAWIRLREEGHVFVGEMLVVPEPDTDDLVERLAELSRLLRGADWRMHDLAVVPVPEIHR